MLGSHQSSLWYLDPLGEAAPVCTDLGRSSPQHSNYFTTTCANARTSACSKDLSALYTPVWCAPHSLEALT